MSNRFFADIEVKDSTFFCFAARRISRLNRLNRKSPVVCRKKTLARSDFLRSNIFFKNSYATNSEFRRPYPMIDFRASLNLT